MSIHNRVAFGLDGDLRPGDSNPSSAQLLNPVREEIFRRENPISARHSARGVALLQRTLPISGNGRNIQHV